ncbi:MAG TPA: CHRD domain-containing protein [Candidatus Limnocylindria bacterium]|nr:CHRD domain-containing protein [Candidatus Limnocylindria bacterium]
MRTLRTLLVTTTTLALSILLAGTALGVEAMLSTRLQGGAAEVPPGDPDGSGTASITVNTDTGQVCWEIMVQNIAAATASHIHEGAAGVAGPVVVPLDVDGFEGSTEGCVEDQDAAVLERILANPAGFYVNVHTGDYQGGAVRGQLAAAQRPPNTAMQAPSAGQPGTLAGLGIVLIVAATLAAAQHRTSSRRP